VLNGAWSFAVIGRISSGLDSRQDIIKETLI